MARIVCAVCGRVLRETQCPVVPNSFGDPSAALCPGDARAKAKAEAIAQAEKSEEI